MSEPTQKRKRRRRIPVGRRRIDFTDEMDNHEEIEDSNISEDVEHDSGQDVLQSTVLNSELSAQEDEEQGYVNRPFDWNHLRHLLTEGESLIIKQLSEDEFIISRVTPETVRLARSKPLAGELKGPTTRSKKRRLTRKVKQEFMTPEYLALQQKLADMETIQEEIAWAEAQGIEWERQKHERIEHMKLFEAAVKHLGINKWLPGYETPEERQNAL